MNKSLIALALGIASLAAPMFAQANESKLVPFPHGYRNWYHNHMQVNHTGFAMEAQQGIQASYANALALEGLKTGKYEDGATFALDRFEFVNGTDHTIKPGKRKVLSVMVKDAANHPDTGGWAFEAFKGGDPDQRVVTNTMKDNGKTCFTCHAPFQAQNFVIETLVK
jgi:hypothetical protein